MLYEFVPRFLPMHSPKRTGWMYPKWITIHEVSLGLETRGKDKDFMYYYQKLLQGESTVGYHYLVEANYWQTPRVYQLIENNRTTDHTGNWIGNHYSIGIERLVNEETDFEAAIRVQAALTASLMHEFEIPIHAVVPHKYWSGKECPARLLAGKNGGWDRFIDMTEWYYQKEEEYAQNG